MRHQPATRHSSPGGPDRVWLKYGLAVLLAALALAAGATGIGPWPESGFVSGLILLATGPLFALRMRAHDPSNPNRLGDAPRLDRLPWITAFIGLAEIGAILFMAVSGR